MKPALKFPAKIKHGDSISSEETRPNSVPRARRIRSISGPSTKPLQQMNQRYPDRAMTSSPNSGDSLTACTPRNTTRDSLDFPKIRATRASNTVEVTKCDSLFGVKNLLESTQHCFPGGENDCVGKPRAQCGQSRRRKWAHNPKITETARLFTPVKQMAGAANRSEGNIKEETCCSV
ncbi:unnamed protein product [Pleuronectes platessa]|uniref:Uncharacterized protein n=1 Tax=Pleuronectes platessa TaxID=8262 RepID=A0A9N7YAC8_PLEPL|nr:unnamed protein product [Pleuronectes platessa]